MGPSGSPIGGSTTKQTCKKNMSKKAKRIAAKKRKAFLYLPGEIRNNVYRNLLVAQCDAARVPNPEYLASRAESEPIGHPIESRGTAVGTLRCKNIWKAQCGFYLDILRANRQIYQEASSIFRDENQWVVLKSDKPGFGRALRENGFNVVYCGDVSHIENPILTISVCFFSRDLTKAIDTCILSLIDIDQLSRALWTAVGMQGLVLWHQDSPTPSAIEKRLIRHFGLIRGLRCVNVTPNLADVLHKGVGNENYENSAEILEEMTQSLTMVQSYKAQELWLLAAETCVLTISHLADCYKVYGSTFVERPFNVFRRIKTVMTEFAMELSELKSMLQQYDLGLKYAKYAFRNAEHPGPLSRLFLLRGQAYTGLNQYSRAMRDLLHAQEHKSGDPLILGAFTALKRSLDPDPAKALDKFKTLRAAVEKPKKQLAPVVSEGFDMRFPSTLAEGDRCEVTAVEIIKRLL